MASLRGIQQPELSKKLYKIIKSENHAIGAYESASRERIAIASQLSDWGEATGDDSISDISDKLGVLLAELGEQEDSFAQNLEEYRGILKQIRNTESSVQPSRDHKAKVADEIQKLKYKEPQSTKIVQLEQELVRAEAQNLVAEAQLTNIVRALRSLVLPLQTPYQLTPHRPAKNSKKPTISTSLRPSNAPKNKSSSPATVAVSSTSSTTLPSSPATHVPPSTTHTKRARSSRTPRRTCATGSHVWNRCIVRRLSWGRI
ncbi:MAG: hypothetical protein Q9187_006520 [Circinaria calcarea]